jgi:hypothetical protein
MSPPPCLPLPLAPRCSHCLPPETVLSLMEFFSLFWSFLNKIWKINLANFPPNMSLLSGATNTTYEGVTLVQLVRVIHDSERFSWLGRWHGATSALVVPRRLTWLSRVDYYSVTVGPAMFHLMSTSRIITVDAAQSHQTSWRDWWTTLMTRAFLPPLSSLFLSSPFLSLSLPWAIVAATLASTVGHRAPAVILPQARSSDDGFVSSTLGLYRGDHATLPTNDYMLDLPNLALS